MAETGDIGEIGEIGDVSASGPDGDPTVPTRSDADHDPIGVTDPDVAGPTGAGPTGAGPTEVGPTDGVFHPLHPAAPLIWRVVGVAWAAAFGLVGAVVAALVFGRPAGIVAAAITVASVAIAWWYPSRRYRYWRYRIGDDALEVRRGVWFRTSAAVPFHRIQQIDVEQGPLQRRHDVVTLRLRTAAAASEGEVPHLAAVEADLLRQRLLAIARTAGDDGH